RHAVVRGWIEPVRPGDMAVVMGVDIDEARRHQPARRIDLFLTPALDRADGGDLAALHRAIAGKPRPSRPIDDRALADDKVELHGHSCFSSLVGVAADQAYPHRERR